MSSVSKSSAYPDTVQPGIPKLSDQPPHGWKRTTFGDHLYEEKRPVKMDDNTEYDLVTVKRARGGVVKRERKLGADISVKTQFEVKDGDFLISKRQIVHGACGIVPPQLDGSTVSNEYAVLRGKNSIDLKFLKHFSHSVFFQQTCFHSSIGVHIEKMIFKTDKWFGWEFDLPSVDEQRRIAEILSTWDRAIETTEKLIANSQAQKKALMQQLLTGKKRLPGFDGEWKKVRLSDCADCLDNKRVPLNGEERAQMNGDIPYYGANGVVDLINKHIFDQDLVLLAEDGGYFDEFSTRPIAQFVSGKSWVNNHAHILSAKSSTTEKWLYFSLVHKNILAFINGGTRAKLNKSDMLLIPIMLPPKEEQEAITDILDNAEKTVANLKERVLRLNAEKAALMQQLLTGKRRVKIEEAANA